MSPANSPTESIREDLASPALLKELYETCNAKLKPNVEISLSDKSTIDGKIVIRCNDKFLLLIQRFFSSSNSGACVIDGIQRSQSEESTKYTTKWFIDKDGVILDGTIAWVTTTGRRENVMEYSSKEPPRTKLVQGVLDQIEKMPIRTEKQVPTGILEGIKEFVLRLVKTA